MHIGIVHVRFVNVANVLHLVVNVSDVHESYGVECPSTRQGPAIQACQRDRLGLGDALQASRPVLSSTNCYERLVSFPVFFSRILREAPLRVTLGSIGLQALNSPASNPKTDRTTGEEVEQFNSCASTWTNTRNMGSAGNKDCMLFSDSNARMEYVVSVSTSTTVQHFHHIVRKMLEGVSKIVWECRSNTLTTFGVGVEF